MEKISLRTKTNEIVLKGAPNDGHMDIFSYEEIGAKAGLGSLYIVGNTSGSADDASYVVNLISSLAKREYYLNPELTPKESFAATLKKINGVVEEFFKNNSLKMNIGVFAIADENILISKLGKFKIILARDDKTVDVLNNIELFNKEHIQEKEFSNILSGKVKTGDKILAYYTNKAVVTREKSLKTDFLHLNTADFSEKINSIKGTKPNFGCAMVCINIDEFKEAIMPAVKPKVKTYHPQSPAAKEPAAPSPEMLAPNPKPVLANNQTKADNALNAQTAPNNNANNSDEIPRIIPTEFSSWKKQNIMSQLFNKLTFRARKPGLKIISATLAAVILIATALVLRTTIFPSPETKELRQTVSSVQANIKDAKKKISENNYQEARSLLLASIASLENIDGDGEQNNVPSLRQQVLAELDQIDGAKEASPVLVYDAPTELGKAKLISTMDNNLFIWTGDTSSDGHLLKIDNNSLSKKSDLKDQDPSTLLNSSYTTVFSDKDMQKIYAFKDDKIVNEINLTAPAKNIYLYQDNLYILSADGISKTTDATHGNTKAKNWLANGVALPNDPIMMLVDGNVYVFSVSGIMTTYYKGEKSKEAQTNLALNKDYVAASWPDSKYIFLLDKNLGRIYKISKENGSLESTVKIGSAEPIMDASAGNDDSVYFITSNNKVWKISF